ncbi:MAG: serine/threonine protein kinase [Microscillaceae bacterium]|nr:serine/threonine protein kinase [Microscillaceae bacterium]MDW8461237.1 serine/threonine-protein kinase [Cytophagales bacterium]
MTTTKIHNYQIASICFEGSTAYVYVGIHTTLGRKVIIKAFKPEYTPLEVQAKLRNLAQQLTSIKHIYLTTLYDYFEQEGQSFFISEYAQGQSLKEYLALQVKPMDENKAIFFMSKILEAIQYAHNQGIIHKDLHPNNIFITPDAQIKITDLGLASIFKEKYNHLYSDNQSVGNICYLSPEQVEGKLSTEKTDIYTLGIILWEMLTGKSLAMLYEKADKNEIYQKILHENILDLPESKAISERLQKVIAKAIQKNPDQRYASCEAFKQDLRTGLDKSLTLKSTKKITDKKKEVTTIPQRLLKYTIYTALGISIGIFLIQLLSVNDTKQNNLANTEQKNLKKIHKTDNNNETKVIETEDEKEEEEKSAEEKAIDSLKKEQNSLKQELKAIKENRRHEVMKDLIIDTQLEDEKLGELSILITLSNLRKDVTFRNITFHTIYTDHTGKELETEKRELEILKPEQTHSIKVTKTINASKFTTKLKSTDIEDNTPLPIIDTIQAKIKRIENEIEKLKEIKEKKQKEKEREKNK